MTLIRPDYVEYKDGQLDKLFCQICGVQIAGMVERPKGSGLDIDKLVIKFKRFPNYAEAKFQCTDDSFHVTNGCKKCFTKLDVKIAQEVYDADMAVMEMPIGKKIKCIKQVDTSKAGIF